MHVTPLFLSHWDASIPICVSGDVTVDLKNYHCMGVRFLYDCFQKGQRGAILNHENGMNFQLQVSAFFNALRTFVTPESPALVVCPEESLNVWHYHLTKHGGYDITVLSARNYQGITEAKTHSIILTTVENAKLLREIKSVNFFAVVVEQLDVLITKNVVKQRKSQFNIGLTQRNFLRDPDQKLFWTMLNWSNPGVVGKLAEFYSEDSNHLVNMRYPYGAWWQRLTWKFCDSFHKPADEEQKQYKALLHKWSRQHKLHYNYIPEPEVKRQTKKQKVIAENSTKEEANSDEDETDIPQPRIKRQIRKYNLVSENRTEDELNKREDEADAPQPRIKKQLKEDETDFLQPRIMRQTRKHKMVIENLTEEEPYKREDKADGLLLKTKKESRRRHIVSEKSTKEELSVNAHIPQSKSKRQKVQRKMVLESSSDEESNVKEDDSVLQTKTKRQTRKRKVLVENSPKEGRSTETNEALRALFDEGDSLVEGVLKNTKNIPSPSHKPEEAGKERTSSCKDSQETVLDTNDCSQNLNNSFGVSHKHSQDLNSSEATIIYDDVDENPILTSIMGSQTSKVTKLSLDESQSVKGEHQSSSKGDILSLLYDESKPETHVDDDDILTSIIKSKSRSDPLNQDVFHDSLPVKLSERNEIQKSDVDSTSSKNDILSFLFGNE